MKGYFEQNSMVL